jgi:cytochrome c-type biogenesis protein CcmH/NrfG
LELRLARHGAQLHPLNPEVVGVLATALERAGQPEEALAAWVAVERMLPAGFPQRDQATARRRALQAEAAAEGGR